MHCDASTPHITASTLLQQPLSDIMAQQHWSEVQVRRELRRVGNEYRLGVPITSTWEMLQGTHEASTADPRPPPIPTGIEALDHALFGGLHPQSLVELISAQSTTAGRGGCPIIERSPCRLLAARMAQDLLQVDRSASAMWLHPSPGDTTLDELFLAEEAETGAGWHNRLLLAGVEGGHELMERTRAVRDSLNAMQAGHLRLVVLEDVTLLLQRSFNSDVSAQEARDRLELASSLVDLWKAMALRHNLVVLWLTTASVRCLTDGMGYFRLQVPDVISRAFSHAMNVRMSVAPGWFLSQEQPPRRVHRVQVLKSPMCGTVMVPFIIGSDGMIEAIPTTPKQSRPEEWVSEHVQCALDPLDYVWRF